MLQIYHKLYINTYWAFCTTFFHFVWYITCFLACVYVCLCVYVCVCYLCAIPSACLRSLLACILCCDHQDPSHPPDLDLPFPSFPSTARPSLTPLQGAVERPQTTLPLPSPSLAPVGHLTTALRGQVGEEAMGDRGSLAGLSVSTLTPSEGMDMWRLLRTPRRQHQALGSFCSRVAARLRRMNLNTWYDCQLWTSWTFILALFDPFLTRMLSWDRNLKVQMTE